jgi:hypothetical protein
MNIEDKHLLEDESMPLERAWCLLQGCNGIEFIGSIPLRKLSASGAIHTTS